MAQESSSPMSLQNWVEPPHELHSLAQGGTAVLVVEGVTDERFWRSCLSSDKFSCYVAEGRQNLEDLTRECGLSNVLFLYDSDFEDPIDSPNALSYPGADRESFMFNQRGLNLISAYAEEIRGGVPVGKIFENIIGAASLVGDVREANRKVPISERIDFNEGEWCKDRFRKVETWRDLSKVGEEKIRTHLKNAHRLILNEVRLGKGELYNGKDAIIVFCMFLHEFSNFAKSRNMNHIKRDYRHVLMRLEDFIRADKLDLEFISLINDELGRRALVGR